MAVEAGDRALETARKVCRELYDRFVMGGWEPQDAHEQCAAEIQSAMNAQEREIAKLIDLYTGPTGGWLVAPVFLKAEIERLLAERGGTV